MQGFVDDLLDLSSLKEGVFNLATQPFDIVDVMKNCVNMFGPSAADKKLNIRVKVQN